MERRSRQKRSVDALVQGLDGAGVRLPPRRAASLIAAVADAVRRGAAATGPSGRFPTLADLYVEERTGRISLACAATPEALVALATELLARAGVASAPPFDGTPASYVAACAEALGVPVPERRGFEALNPTEMAAFSIALLGRDPTRQAYAIRGASLVFGSRVKVDHQLVEPTQLAFVDGDDPLLDTVLDAVRSHRRWEAIRVVAIYASPPNRDLLALYGVVDVAPENEIDVLEEVLRKVGQSSGWRVRVRRDDAGSGEARGGTKVGQHARRALRKLAERPRQVERVVDDEPRRERRSSDEMASPGVVPAILIFAVTACLIFLAGIYIARTSHREPVLGDPSSMQRR